MKIDGILARNVDFEVGPSDRKTSILELRNLTIGRSLARKARFEAPTCLASILWFSSAVAVSMGKLQNLSLSKDSKQVVASFCVAGVALCDIQTCFVMRQKLFCVAGAALWIPPSSFRVTGATL